MSPILRRFWPPKLIQNDPKMEPKFASGRPWGTLWVPRAPKSAQWTPRSLKIEPKRPQNGAQDTSKAPKMEPWNPPGLPKWTQKTPWAPKWMQTDRKTATQTVRQTQSATFDLNWTEFEINWAGFRLTWAQFEVNWFAFALNWQDFEFNGADFELNWKKLEFNWAEFEFSWMKLALKWADFEFRSSSGRQTDKLSFHQLNSGLWPLASGLWLGLGGTRVA